MPDTDTVYVIPHQPPKEWTYIVGRAWVKDLENDIKAQYKPLNVTLPKRPEFKAEWLKVLRSGTLLQGSDALRMILPLKQWDAESEEWFPVRGAPTKIGYCCLGVGCNLISHRKGWYKYEEEEFGWRDNGPGDVKALEWIDSKAATRLAAANDAHVPFPIIAEWIERYL